MTTDELKGKECSIETCHHAAHSKWEWAPGHGGGYRCACCLRSIWQATLDNVTKSLGELPEICSPAIDE